MDKCHKHICPCISDMIIITIDIDPQTKAAKIVWKDFIEKNSIFQGQRMCKQKMPPLDSFEPNILLQNAFLYLISGGLWKVEHNIFRNGWVTAMSSLVAKYQN